MKKQITKSATSRKGRKLSRKKTAIEPIRPWSVWRFLAWTFVTIFLLVLIAIAYGWANRYSLLEDLAQETLAGRGLEASLTIDDITREGAELSDIKIAHNGETVFNAAKVQARYDWREALKGHVKRIVIEEADIRMKVNESGKVIDSWMPKGDPNAPLILPPEGVVITDSHLYLQSPYGDADANGTIRITSLEDLSAELSIKPGDFSYGSINAQGGGDINLQISPQGNRVDALLSLSRLSHPLLDLDGADIQAALEFDVVDGRTRIAGPLSLEFTALRSAPLSSGNGDLQWDGVLETQPNKAAVKAADGEWALSFTDVKASDAPGLAKGLTLSKALTAAPIAQHFSPMITAQVQSLLSGSDLTASGRFIRSDEAVRFFLADPLTLTNTQAGVTFSPLGREPAYDYYPETDALGLKGNVELAGAYPLSLEGLELSIHSSNGVRVDAAQSAKARINLRQNWKTQYEGDIIRIAPTLAEISYQRGGGDKSRLSLGGVYNIDGPLPGGFVMGLKTEGLIEVTGQAPYMAVRFLPARPAITVDRFTTNAGWQAQGLSFDLNSTAPFYVAKGGSRNLSATLGDFKGDMKELSTGRMISLIASGLDMQADVSTQPQNWKLTATDVQANTDDFIGEDTQMKAASVMLSAALTPEQPPRLELQTPAADISTPLMRIAAMPIGLSGTPTAMSIAYGQTGEPGRVQLANKAVPPLPLRGDLEYIDGEFVGRASTLLPKTTDTEIDISYRIANGAGTAKVSLPHIRFAREKLQPQDLVRALQGKIADVNGVLEAEFDLAFAAGQPLQSSGRARIREMDFGTLPGPFKGVNTELEFDSIFPLKTSGRQIMTMAQFNPGVALQNGTVEYELQPDGLQIHSAIWPMEGGAVSLSPTRWRYNAEQNRVELKIQDVPVSAFVGRLAGENLTVTGQVDGLLPVLIEGVDVSVDGGLLQVKNGGVITLQRDVADVLEQPLNDIPPYMKKFKGMMGFDAMKNFNYRYLEARLNGPLDGEIEVTMGFEGSNPKILAGTRFNFNVTVIGELINIARSLKPQSDLSKIKRYIITDREGGSLEVNPNRTEPSSPTEP